MSRKPGTRQSNAVVLGSEGVGKKTLLKRWRDNGKIRSTSPTMGANVHVLPWNACLFSYEGSGHLPARERLSHIRSFLRVTQSVSVLLLLVASDAGVTELEATRDLLSCVIGDSRFAKTRLLVACNKQDVHGAASCRELALALKLGEVDHQLEVFSLSALTGYGVDRLFEALQPPASTLDGGLRSPTIRARSPKRAREQCARAPPPTVRQSDRHSDARSPGRLSRAQSLGRQSGAESPGGRQRRQKGGPYNRTTAYKGGHDHERSSKMSSVVLRWQRAGQRIAMMSTFLKAGMEWVGEFPLFLKDDFGDDPYAVPGLDRVFDTEESSKGYMRLLSRR